MVGAEMGALGVHDGRGGQTSTLAAIAVVEGPPGKAEEEGAAWGGGQEKSNGWPVAAVSPAGLWHRLGSSMEGCVVRLNMEMRSGEDGGERSRGVGMRPPAITGGWPGALRVSNFRGQVVEGSVPLTAAPRAVRTVDVVRLGTVSAGAASDASGASDEREAEGGGGERLRPRHMCNPKRRRRRRGGGGTRKLTGPAAVSNSPSYSAAYDVNQTMGNGTVSGGGPVSQEEILARNTLHEAASTGGTGGVGTETRVRVGTSNSASTAGGSVGGPSATADPGIDENDDDTTTASDMLLSTGASAERKGTSGVLTHDGGYLSALQVNELLKHETSVQGGMVKDIVEGAVMTDIKPTIVQETYDVG